MKNCSKAMPFLDYFFSTGVHSNKDVCTNLEKKDKKKKINRTHKFDKKNNSTGRKPLNKINEFSQP